MTSSPKKFALFFKKKIRTKLSEWSIFPWRKHLILIFHRVKFDKEPSALFDTCPCISLGLFSEVIDRVKANYSCVPLKYLSEHRRSKIPLAAVTFDDGWLDNYEYAFPLLKNLEVPATIFITTGKIGSSEPFWQQKLGLAFQSVIEKTNPHLETILREIIGAKPNKEITRELFFRTVTKWKSWKLETIETILGRLPLNFIKEKKRLFLNSKEIVEMSKHGIDFGSHTVDHTILTNESIEEIVLQLKKSKQSLEQLLQKPIEALAYPNGDFNPQIEWIAKNLGFSLGCTTKRKKVSEKDNILRLPRIEISSQEEVLSIIPRKGIQ